MRLLRLLRLFAAIFSSQSLQKIMKTRHLHPSFAFIFTAGCGLLLLTAQAADAQPKPAPKPAPKRAALQREKAQKTEKEEDSPQMNTDGTQIKN